jgi:cysteine-S-conjugate beta-lyase
MKDDTKLVTSGRDPEKQLGAVNTPVYHASTILFPTVAALQDAWQGKGDWLLYGRRGTPTTFGLQEALAEVEGGYACRLAPSGLAAITTALLAYLSSGDHLLMTDSVYGPTRAFCDGLLARMGVETTYYDPLIGANVDTLMRPNTKVVFTEAPGSVTFEIQDIPAIAAAAHAGGAICIMDNTWATPLFFKPFTHGVDVSVHAGTKYIVGHSDAMLGTITTTEAAWPRLIEAHDALGQCGAPDDAYLGQRGLRTMGVRLRQQQETGLTLARWLADRPEVERVLHPGLPGDPGHELWKRDFTGASGLFGAVLKPCSQDAVTALVDNLDLYGLGYSWGGYESLIMFYDPSKMRTATIWDAPGPTIRIHAGLEDPTDLIADLDQAFEHFNAVAG